MRNLLTELKVQKFHSIRDKMNERDILYKKAKFVAFHDGFFVFNYKTKGVVFEFSVICDDVLLAKMTILELLNLKNTEYFDVREFIMPSTIGYSEEWNIEFDDSKRITKLKSLKEIQNKILEDGIRI